MASFGSTSGSNLDSPSHAGLVRACATCSRAKAKCVSDPKEDGKCQRCCRLRKICEPAVPQIRSVPRKRKPQTAVPKSRVGRLEERLEGLVSLITSTQDLTSSRSTELDRPSMSDAVPINPMTGSFSFPALSMRASSAQGQVRGELPAYQKGTAAAQFIPNRPTPSLATIHGLNNFPALDSNNWINFMPSFAEGDVLLAIYRDKLTPQFPFIVLPQSVSAETLNLEKPFFYLCIIAVTKLNSLHQKALGKLIMKQLGERLFARGERNLDLLLGALTYAAWCFYNCWNIPQVTSLISAANVLVLDLGLSRPLPSKKAPNRSVFYEALRDSCSMGLLAWTKTSRTLEEERAFLGYYFLSSVISLYLRRMEPPQKFTPYVEDCVKSLESFGDHPNDKLAVVLVRLQAILERVHQTSWQKKPDLSEINSGTLFIITSIEKELEQFRKNLQSEQASNATILMQCHIIEISIYEAGLCQPPPGADPIPSFKRLELLCACLEATKSYFNVFFSIPSANYISMSLSTWSQMGYAMAILQTLFILQRPDWDLDSVRGAIDYNITFNQLIQNLESLITLPGFEKLDVFSRSAKWMKSVKEYVETKMAALPVATVEDESYQVPDFGWMPGAEDVTDFFQFLDDAWMSDILPVDPQVSTMTGT
ncbi:hypothetical protein N431DRAFT_545212 [Stipitochalara longipes BDJ]|nr:hypothetical protein N431DRAFT_545212 [Stipitochalara longipes BDJ]